MKKTIVISLVSLITLFLFSAVVFSQGLAFKKISDCRLAVQAEHAFSLCSTSLSSVTPAVDDDLFIAPAGTWFFKAAIVGEAIAGRYVGNRSQPAGQWVNYNGLRATSMTFVEWTGAHANGMAEARN